jgi:endonuclease III
MQLSLALSSSPLAAVRDRLLAIFGPQRPTERLDPVSQLVKASISVRTRDAVAWAAFRRLRDRFPAWEILAETRDEDLTAVLQDVTLAEEKARHLAHALRLIQIRCKWSLTLDHLRDLEIDSARWWLQGLPGVGVEVAASVLNFSTLSMRALVVDAHVHRVARRLGLIPSSADAAHAYRPLMDQAPDHWSSADLFELHCLMKGLGQLVCEQEAPQCGACPLKASCPKTGVGRSAEVLVWRAR